jgi:hypothetical protein
MAEKVSSAVEGGESPNFLPVGGRTGVETRWATKS